MDLWYYRMLFDDTEIRIISVISWENPGKTRDRRTTGENPCSGIPLENKRGYIPENLPPILDRINLDPDTWLEELIGFKSVGFSAVGTIDQLKEFCKKVGKKFAVGHRLKPALE